MNIMHIEITDPKAIEILLELEKLNLIKVVKEDLTPSKTRLSYKYKGVFSKEDAESFNKHTQTMRGEWGNI
jgi:hypothetical protein